MYMQYDVTIGIPVYKSVDYIDRTINSALCQTYPSIEFLILDDCGNDGSMEIVEKYKDEHPRGVDIHIIHHERNFGVGVARNRIIDEAQGLYLYFLDSDDLMEPDTIEKMVSSMDNTNSDVVYGSWERVDLVNHMPSQNHQYSYQEFLSSDKLAMYAFKNYSLFRISVCNCLMDINFLREEKLKFIDAVFWEDLAFTYKLVIKVKRAVLLPDITYHYLCRPGSLSHYEDREILKKEEILKNVETINYLKDECRFLSKKSFIPYLCYNLEMNSFYIVCHILKQYHRIVPVISSSEMRSFFFHPMNLWDILSFKHKKIHNLVFWGISHMPLFLFRPSVKLLGRIKKIL